MSGMSRRQGPLPVPVYVEPPTAPPPKPADAAQSVTPPPLALAGRRRKPAATVTICVPCYQQASYLPKALASINAQTLPPLEVIVIDDGSPEVESAKIKRICKAHGARYVWVTNRKLPSARNVGIMLAKGDAFVPLDADDWLEPTYIEKLYPLFLEGADVVIPGLQEHGETRNKAYMPGFDRPLGEVTLDVMWNSFNRTFYCSMFRISLLREVGGYNGLMVLGYEDYDLACDLMARGAKYVPCNEILFNYRTRMGSMLSEAERHRTEIIAEMRRHHAGR